MISISSLLFYEDYRSEKYDSMIAIIMTKEIIYIYLTFRTRKRVSLSIIQFRQFYLMLDALI